MLVSLSFIGVLAMFSNGQTTVYSSGQDRTSAQLAQQRIEQVRATGYGAKFPPDPREEDIWTPIAGNPGYERTTVVTNVCSTNFAIANNGPGCAAAEGPEPQAKLVVVTVRALNNNQELVDPRTTPSVVQTVLVRR